jgi:hypothetical protein
MWAQVFLWQSQRLDPSMYEGLDAVLVGSINLVVLLAMCSVIQEKKNVGLLL